MLIIAIVHDEIIVEAPEAKAEHLKKLLAKIMVSVFEKPFKKKVPIKVDAKICDKLKLGLQAVKQNSGSGKAHPGKLVSSLMSALTCDALLFHLSEEVRRA